MLRGFVVKERSILFVVLVVAVAFWLEETKAYLQKELVDFAGIN